MTDKEKAIAYDEALKKASAAYKDEDKHLKTTLRRIFPELNENKDEMIKTAILNHLKKMWGNCQDNICGVHIEDTIKWLEKQGKNSTDKTEPKFKVGDWVVFGTSKSVYQVEKIENYEYTLRHVLGGSLCLPFSNEKLIREWTIQDAKDGDVLVCNDEILLFKSYSEQGKISLYCWYNEYKNMFVDKEVIDISLTTKNKICPATKKQHDILYKKIKERKEKFDPKTLKPFDKVLVRDKECSIWKINMFSYIDNNARYPYDCLLGSYKYCVPYNDETKHLVGTKEEAPEYYKYWED